MTEQTETQEQVQREPQIYGLRDYHSNGLKKESKYTPEQLAFYRQALETILKGRNTQL